MEKLLVKDKDVVVPGEVIAEGMGYLPSFGTYREGDKIMANRTGLLSVDGKVVKTIPLAGRYLPKRNDVIIARISDILMSGWRVDTNSPYSAVLPLQEASFKYLQKTDDLSKFFALDDFIVTKILKVTSQKLVDISMKSAGLRKLDGGRIIEVNTHKVPRIIGKQGSMVTMIKDATGCRITVGQNGRVWIQGEPDKELIAVEAIHLIESKAHHSGLTDEIKSFLEKKGLKVVKPEPRQEQHQNNDENSSQSSNNGEVKKFQRNR